MQHDFIDIQMFQQKLSLMFDEFFGSQIDHI